MAQAWPQREQGGGGGAEMARPAGRPGRRTASDAQLWFGGALVIFSPRQALVLPSAPTFLAIGRAGGQASIVDNAKYAAFSHPCLTTPPTAGTLPDFIARPWRRCGATSHACKV